MSMHAPLGQSTTLSPWAVCASSMHSGRGCACVRVCVSVCVCVCGIWAETVYVCVRERKGAFGAATLEQFLTTCNLYPQLLPIQNAFGYMMHATHLVLSTILALENQAAVVRLAVQEAHPTTLSFTDRATAAVEYRTAEDKGSHHHSKEQVLEGEEAAEGGLHCPST